MERAPDQELSKVMAWLAEKMRCPLCNSQHNLQSIKVVPRHGSRADVLAHTVCGECRSSLLFAVDIRGGEVYLVGIVTDLTYHDTLKFQSLKPLSVEEVIDWHNFLNSFDGDMVKALA